MAEQLDLVRGELDSGLYGSLPHGIIHGDVREGPRFFERLRDDLGMTLAHLPNC